MREGLELLESQPFQSAKLRRLAEQARGSAAHVRKLERLLNALQERTKDWFYLPSLLLMAGTQLLMAVEQWRAANGEPFRAWLAAWAELEALNALACYAYENPDNTFPEVTDGPAHFEALAAGHPLLPGDTCVRNDVALNGNSRFYIISGSNMSGKSTLLRTIGLNAVLAQAGAPVRASRLRQSRLAVCASLAPAESLADGRSRFMAEVERLKQAIARTREEAPVLFLVDEIFSGTNSSDRRVAAEAVVRTLVDRGAIGALSTHDLALSEIAAYDGLGGVNVHMGSADGGGPMDFDYLLKAGVTTEANALAIARMAGVTV
jgi:DNA mismatch repair ATPase MutS